MENKTLYDAVLEYETTLFVNHFDKDFETMLSHLPGCPSKIGQRHTVTHTIEITNSPVLPEEQYIVEIRGKLFETAKETFESRNDINATVEKTEFVGIKSLKTKNV